MENKHYFRQYLEFELGFLLIEANTDRVLKITFVQNKTEEHPNEVTFLCANQLQEYFLGQRKTFTCPISLNGTSFQIKVWLELLNVPYGHIITYKKLAARIGMPNAYRAVANAMAANHLPIIIPCHRVIASDGTLGGYSAGVKIKKWLLKLEGMTF